MIWVYRPNGWGSLIVSLTRSIYGLPLRPSPTGDQRIGVAAPPRSQRGDEDAEREEERQGEADRVQHLIAAREHVVRTKVVDRVGKLVGEVGDGGGNHQAAVEADRRDHEQDPEG